MHHLICYDAKITVVPCFSLIHLLTDPLFWVKLTRLEKFPTGEKASIIYPVVCGSVHVCHAYLSNLRFLHVSIGLAFRGSDYFLL